MRDQAELFDRYDRLQPELGRLFSFLADAPQIYQDEAYDILTPHFAFITQHGERITRYKSRIDETDRRHKIAEQERRTASFPRAEELSRQMFSAALDRADFEDAASIAAAQISVTLFPAMREPSKKRLSVSDYTAEKRVYELVRWRGLALCQTLTGTLSDADRAFFRKREYRNYHLHADENIDRQHIDPRTAVHSIIPINGQDAPTFRIPYFGSGDPSTGFDEKEFDNDRYISIALEVSHAAERSIDAMQVWCIYRHGRGERCSRSDPQA